MTGGRPAPGRRRGQPGRLDAGPARNSGACPVTWRGACRILRWRALAGARALMTGDASWTLPAVLLAPACIVCSRSVLAGSRVSAAPLCSCCRVRIASHMALLSRAELQTQVDAFARARVLCGAFTRRARAGTVHMKGLLVLCGTLACITRMRKWHSHALSQDAVPHRQRVCTHEVHRPESVAHMEFAVDHQQSLCTRFAIGQIVMRCDL